MGGDWGGEADLLRTIAPSVGMKTAVAGCIRRMRPSASTGRSPARPSSSVLRGTRFVRALASGTQPTHQRKENRKQIPQKKGLLWVQASCCWRCCYCCWCGYFLCAGREVYFFFVKKVIKNSQSVAKEKGVDLVRYWRGTCSSVRLIYTEVRIYVPHY